MRYVLPLVGGLISGDYDAYISQHEYRGFPYGEDFCDLMREAGFESVRAHPVTFGIATIYEACKQPAQAH